jgi:hypothetical protein
VSTFERMKQLAESNGCRLERRPEDGAILLYTPIASAEYTEREDCDRIRNMNDLRILLGI